MTKAVGYAPCFPSAVDDPPTAAFPNRGPNPMPPPQEPHRLEAPLRPLKPQSLPLHGPCQGHYPEYREPPVMAQNLYYNGLPTAAHGWRPHTPY
jgi:hypothetical protein